MTGLEICHLAYVSYQTWNEWLWGIAHTKRRFRTYRQWLALVILSQRTLTDSRIWPPAGQREIMLRVSQRWATRQNDVGPTTDFNVGVTDVQRLDQRRLLGKPTMGR